MLLPPWCRQLRPPWHRLVLRRPPLYNTGALPQTSPSPAKLSSAKRGGPSAEPPAAPPGENFFRTTAAPVLPSGRTSRSYPRQAKGSPWAELPAWLEITSSLLQSVPSSAPPLRLPQNASKCAFSHSVSRKRPKSCKTVPQNDSCTPYSNSVSKK